MRKLDFAVAAFAAALIAILAGPTAAADVAPAAKPPVIPTSVFAEMPTFWGPKLSPDGKRLLLHITVNAKEMVAIVELATGQKKYVAPPEKSEIADYRWAGNDRVLVSYAQTIFFFGDDARMTRLSVYDIPSGKLQLIATKDEGLVGDDVLYVDPSGGWLLLAMQATVFDYPSVYRVDLATAKMKLALGSKDYVLDWYADEHGVVRAGIGIFNNSWFEIYRTRDGEDFHRIEKGRLGDDEGNIGALRIFYNSDNGYVLSSKRTGRYALYKYNFATREVGDLVLENPTNDIDDFDTDAQDNVIWAHYVDDRDRLVWFDPQMKEYQSALENSVQGRQAWIKSKSDDGHIMIVWVGSANDPGSYYVFQPAAGVMQAFGRDNEKIDRRQLAPTSYINYKARDGLEIAGYLTLPVGRDPKNLPLIIMPHGGPYGVRDALAYDPEVQFLANRGYVVLQPNYRGSSSYGREFAKKGEGQWGRQMQDDLDDGMDWLVKQGTVDPKRVCIVGGSYGGYAALWGATRNPERYRCAASFAGVTDLKAQLKYDSNFFADRKYERNWMHTVQGDKSFDMDTISPLRQVARLRVPVLLAHGDADRNVPYRQSTSYAQALKEAGKTYEFYTYKDEGHGFSTKEHMQDWLDHLEAFLAKYNPAA